MATENDRKNHRAWYLRNIEKVRILKRENMRRYRAENPEKYAAQSRRAKGVLRQKLFSIYGEKCALCGFSDIRALTLDHLLNNGAKERKELGERGPYYRA